MCGALLILKFVEKHSKNTLFARHKMAFAVEFELIGHLECAKRFLAFEYACCFNLSLSSFLIALQEAHKLFSSIHTLP